MKFTPKTEKEITEENLLPEGRYDFEISGAEETLSKKGNEMIKLMVRVYKPDGKFNIVTDYLLESMLYKLLHCCEACDLMAQYESGRLSADDFIGKTGQLKLVVKIDETGNYPDQNSIKDYVVDKNKPITKNPLQEVLDEANDDDEIPF